MEDMCMDSLVNKQPHDYGSQLPGTVWIENLRNSLPCRGNITPEVIEKLERELEFYEIVSLVFLLYDHADTALQVLITESASHNGSLPQSGLLFKWARSQAAAGSPHWEAMFLEALCIIQNYKIVEKLGYQKSDVNEQFLPCNPDIALNVNLMRKALYHMCERLTFEQSRRLVNLVTQDLMETDPNLPSLNSLEPAYLEMHILFWLSRERVIIHNQDVNLTNITKHLKKMEEFHLIEYLESVAKRYAAYVNDCANDQIINESVLSNCHPAHSVVSTSDEISHYEITQTAVRYHIDPKNVGYCVIINQKNFYEETNPPLNLKDLLAPETLEDRTGTDKDRDSLIEAFGNFGFKVKVWDNLTHTELLKCIEISTQSLEDNHSCFVLCILSHGQRNAVYGVNSVAVSVDQIEHLIHCRRLIGKPKVLIIQACQGHRQLDALPCNVTSFTSDIASDGPTHSQQTRPKVSDMLTLWSTVPGYASFRDRVKGSWYIQTLCEHLLMPTVEADLLDVALAVNCSIQARSADIYGENKSMQPQFTVTLSKKLVLPCGREARRAVARRMALRHLFDAMLDEYLRREYRRVCPMHGGV